MPFLTLFYGCHRQTSPCLSLKKRKCLCIHSFNRKKESVECTYLEYVYLLSICKKYTFYFYLSDFSATFACERVKA